MTQKRFMIVPALHEQKFPYASWLFRAILILSAERDRKLEQIRTWENAAERNQHGRRKKKLPKKRWFGRGIYGSKDVPIRILDGLIAFLIVLTVALTAVFAINGGYVVSFDTDGGEVIESQKLRHGSFVEDPGTPVKVTVRFDLAGGTVVRTSQRIRK